MRTNNVFNRMWCMEILYSAFFILLGIVARIWLYLQGFNLQQDEAYLSASIYYSSFKDIINGNFPFGQAVPLGFILSVKFLSLIFGDSEYVLRFIPFVSGLLLLPFAYMLAQREFGTKTACIFLFFLSISDPLLFYTVQFKQYETEALISLIYLNLYCANQKTIKEGNIPFKLVFVAIFLFLFSNALIIVLCGLFLAMLYEQIRDRNFYCFLKRNYIKILIFALVCSAYYFLYLNRINAIKSNFMHSSWSIYYLGDEFGGLSHKIPLYLQYYVMPLVGQYFTAISSITWINALFFISFFCGGIFFLFREKKYISIAIISILFVLLFLHITRFYPLGYPLKKEEITSYVVGIRLLLYFIPISLIPVSICLEKVLRTRQITIFVFCIATAFAVYANHWRINEGITVYETKQLLEHMNRFSEQNSIVFMNKGAEASYLYYQHRNNKFRQYNILDDESLPLPAGIDGNKKEVFKIKDMNSIIQIFNIAYNSRKEYLIFLFTRSDRLATRQASEVLKFIQASYPQKWSVYPSNPSNFNAVIMLIKLN